MYRAPTSLAKALRTCEHKAVRRRHRQVCPSIRTPMTRPYVGRGERHGAHAQVLEAHLREQLGDDALQGAWRILFPVFCILSWIGALAMHRCSCIDAKTCRAGQNARHWDLGFRV
jgi:hypothetical protein